MPHGWDLLRCCSGPVGKGGQEVLYPRVVTPQLLSGGTCV